MTNRVTMFWRRLITAVLALASLFVFARSIDRIGFYRVQGKNRMREWSELQSFREEYARKQAMIDWVNAQANQKTDLKALAASHLPGMEFRSQRREPVKSVAGWSIQPIDMNVRDVPAGQLGDFLAACENARPPLRVVGIEVAATPRQGYVNAQVWLNELIQR